MPERQQMEFVIRKDGTVEERVSGVAGASCEDLTDGIERSLGEVLHREHTGDYFKAQESDGVSLQTGS